MAATRLVDRYSATTAMEDGNADTSANQVRGFEWSHLNRFRDALRLTIEAQQGEVDLLSFSSDGKLLVTSGTADGHIHLWDMPSGLHRASFPVRTGPARRWEESTAALSLDGRRVAALTNSHTIVVWDTASGGEVVRVRHARPLVTVALSPDARHVIGGDDRETHVWSSESGENVHSLEGSARLLAISPDSALLALVEAGAAANRIELWDLPRGLKLTEFAFMAPVRAIAYSPDGTRLACLSAESLVAIYRRLPWSAAGIISPAGTRFTRLAWTADNRHLALIAEDGSVRLYDVNDQRLAAVVRAPATRLTQLAVSGDNHWLATAAPDGRVFVWDRTLLDEHEELRPAQSMSGFLRYSPDGRSLQSQQRIVR